MKKKTMLMVAAAAVLFASCGKGGGSAADLLKGDNEFPVMTIGTSKASLQSTYPATLKGIQDVEVRPKISGFVTKIYVQEGQAVRPGQPLFAIDSETYAAAVRQAKAGVKTAEAALKTATLSFENNKQLFEKNIIGQFEMSNAENTFAQAQAGLAQAQAALASAQQTLAWCNITSPVEGVVGDIPYKVGNLVSGSNVLTTVSKSSTMEAYFSMSENDVLGLTRNAGNDKAAIDSMPAVKLQLIDGSEYAYEGKVVKMSGVINATTGSVQLIAQFPNPDNLLKSGGAGKVIIPENDEAAIVIPQEACSQIQDKTFVYILEDRNDSVFVDYHEITINPQNDGYTYIVTGGLKPGDRIVAKGIAKLTDGMNIKPLTVDEYNQKLKDVAEMASKQGSASGFIDVMSGEKADDEKADEEKTEE